MLLERAGARELAIFRIVVFGLWAVTLILSPPLVLAAEAPGELFQPKGVLALVPDGFWDLLFQPAALWGLSALLLILTLAAAAGVGPWAVVGPAAFLGVFLLDGIHKGFAGFINHAQFGMLYAALLLAVSPAADALRLGRARTPPERPAGVYRFPLVGSALLLAFAYSLIGLHRVARGGLEVFTGDALPTYLALRTFEHSSFGFEWALPILASAPVLAVFKLGFAVTTLFEILSPLALVWRRFRWVWLGVILPFHLTTLVTMNIFFWENLVLLVVLFWALHREPGPRGNPSYSQPRPMPTVRSVDGSGWTA